MRYSLLHRFLLGFCVLTVLGAALPAAVQAQEGKTFFGLSFGTSILTQDPLDKTQTFTDPGVERFDASASFQADSGPVVQGQGFYSFFDWLSAGLAIEWEQHNLAGSQLVRTTDLTGANPVTTEADTLLLGTVNTISILPTVQIHPWRFGSLLPYLTVGLGGNINSLSQNSVIGPRGEGATIDVSNSFAARIGAGTNLFITPAIALFTEFAWKLNDLDVDVKIDPAGEPDPDVRQGVENFYSDTYNFSVMTLNFGAKVYFDLL